MRIKHMLTLALAATVAVAFAVPAVASANWTENGEEINGLHWSKDGAALSGEAGSLSLSGPLAFTSPNGGVSCTGSASATLNADSGSGQLTEVTMNSSSCVVSGGMVFLCGGTKVTTAGASALPWSLSTTESAGARKISISEATFDYVCPSGFKLTVTGTITATSDDSGAISSLTFSGTGKSAIGNVQFTSPTPIAVTPAGKYGIGTRTVAVSGRMGWASPDGSMTCDVNGSLTLKGGTTAGKVTALNWSNCTAGGALVYACGGTQVSTVSKSLPWSATIEGSAIKISNVSITATHHSCVFSFNGNLVAAPDKASAISSTTLSGTLSTQGFNTNWPSGLNWLNWTPPGVFGL